MLRSITSGRCTMSSIEVRMIGRCALQTTSSWFVKSPRVEMPPPVTSRQRPFESQSGMALKLSYA